MIILRTGCLVLKNKASVQSIQMGSVAAEVDGKDAKITVHLSFLSAHGLFRELPLVADLAGCRGCGPHIHIC
jgi:hypothetical protein